MNRQTVTRLVNAEQHDATPLPPRAERVSGPALPGVAALLLGLLLLTGCGRSPAANPSGTLEATEVDVAPALSAKVLEVHPRLGDRVERGDTLVVLDTELLVLKRAQAEAGRNSLLAQRAAAGDGLVQARRNLDLAEVSLDRMDALVRQGSATQQQLDDLAAKRDVAAAQVSAAEHRIEQVEAEIARLNASLDVLDRQLADGVLLAPLSGVVLLRGIEPGEFARAGTTLLRIADLERLELRFYLGEEDLDRVQLGRKLPVLVDALDGDTLTGTVTWISDEAEFTPKNVQTRQQRIQLVYAVKLALENPGGKLHIGMPAEVVLGE